MPELLVFSWLVACSTRPPELGSIPRGYYDACLTHLSDGDCDEAEQACRLALEYGARWAEPHNALGLIELRCRHAPERARDHFKAALAIDPDSVEAHNNLGASFMDRTPPDLESAADEFSAALEINPGHTAARENLVSALLHIGLSADPKERAATFREARAQILRLLEQEPRNARIWSARGLIELVEGRFAEAERAFKRCLEIEPLPSCHGELGRLYALERRCDLAIPELVEALSAPTVASRELRSDLEAAHQQCAEEDDAIQRMLKIIVREPGVAANHLMLGDLFAQRGILDRAASEWRAALALDRNLCIAAYSLAMNAHKNLESGETVGRCREFLSCTLERGGAGTRDQVDRCRTIVLRLGEPEPFRASASPP
jgi:tetratricopeptide (TPR) repeat protein